MVLDLPGLVTDHLDTAGDETVRQTLAAGRTIRRGQGHSLRITAPLELHRAAPQPGMPPPATAAAPPRWTGGTGSSPSGIRRSPVCRVPRMPHAV